MFWIVGQFNLYFLLEKNKCAPIFIPLHSVPLLCVAKRFSISDGNGSIPGYSCLLYFCFLYSECIYDTSTETEGPYDHSICQSATLAGIYQIVLPQEQTWPLQSKVLGHWSSEQFLESWTGIGWQIAKFGHRNSWSSDLEYKLDETCAC